MQRKFKDNRILYFPTEPKSHANYLLLKNDLLSQQVLGIKKFKQITFNTEFLYGILNEYNELHCEYCGKPDLIIYDWFERNKIKDQMATADHFFPKSLDRALLAMEIKNLVVCCFNCNNKKADKIWKTDTLRFPYPETINKINELSKTVKL